MKLTYLLIGVLFFTGCSKEANHDYMGEYSIEPSISYDYGGEIELAESSIYTNFYIEDEYVRTTYKSAEGSFIVDKDGNWTLNYKLVNTEDATNILTANAKGSLMLRKNASNGSGKNLYYVVTNEFSVEGDNYTR